MNASVVGSAERSEIDALVRCARATGGIHLSNMMPRPCGTGNPAKASPEKGQRFFDAVAARIASFLTELAATDPATMYE